MRRHRSSRCTLLFAATVLCAGTAAAQNKQEKKPAPAPRQNAAPVPRPNAPAARPTGPVQPNRSYTPGANQPSEPNRAYTPGGNATPTQPGVPNHGYAPGAGYGTPTQPNGPNRAYTPGGTGTPGQPSATPPNNSYAPRGNAPGSGSTPGYPSSHQPNPTAAGSGGATAGPGGRGYSGAGPGYGASRPAPITSHALSPAESNAALTRMNASRSNLAGVNRQPLPAGTVTQQSNGTYTVAAAGGREYHVRPNGTVATVSMHGQVAAFHPDGRLAALHTQNMDVIHGAHGNRTVVFQRPDHSVVVSTGPHSGYVQRQVMYGGHPYFQRTVLVGGVQYQRVYAGYSFHGVVLQSYVPRYHYAPAFYGYVYYPWSAPVVYSWGWGSAPWFTAYGGYFAPAPAYAAPYDWLADYYVGQTLQDAYAAGEAAGAAQQAAQDAYAAPPPGGNPYPQQGAVMPPPNPNQAYSDESAAPGGAELAAPMDTPISNDIRQSIAQQVQQQVAYENAASTAAQPDDASKLTDLPQVMQPNHVFVVNSTLNASTPQEMTCNLSAGDTVKLTEAPAPDATSADVVVSSSRRADCPVGVHVALALDNLAEMQNSFRAHLDDGLAALHNQQGKGGLPPAPASAIAAPPRPVEYPPTDAENVAKAIDAANLQGTKAESLATQAAFATVATQQ